VIAARPTACAINLITDPLCSTHQRSSDQTVSANNQDIFFQNGRLAIHRDKTKK